MQKKIEDLFSSENQKAHAKLHAWEKVVLSMSCLSLVIMPILFGWLGFFLSLVASGSVFFFVIGGLILKKMGRYPGEGYSRLGALFLAFSAVRPLKIFIFLIFVTIVAIWIVGKPYWKIQEQTWKLSHPGQKLPKPKYFGFVFGETTFDEAVQILTDAGATFQIGNQYVAGKKIEQIPRILIKHYDPLEQLLPLGEKDRTTAIEFDDENKVYLLHVLFSEKVDYDERTQKIAAVNEAYHQKYGPRVDSFNPRRRKYYHIPGGIGIYVDPKRLSIEIANNRKKETVQAYRQKLSLGTWQDDMEALISSS